MASPTSSCSSTSSSSSSTYTGAYTETLATGRERTLVERVVTSEFAQSILKDIPEWDTTRQHLCAHPSSTSLVNNSFFLITPTHVVANYLKNTQHTQDKTDLLDPSKAEKFGYCQIFCEMRETLYKTHDRAWDNFHCYGADKPIPGKNITNFYTCTLNKGTKKELILQYRFLNKSDMSFVKDDNYLPSPVRQYFSDLNKEHERGIELAKKIHALNLKGLDYSACRIIATYFVNTGENNHPASTPSYGSKHDRLVDLKTVVPIPKFFGFSHDQIYGLLSEQTKRLWAQLKSNPDLLPRIQEAVELDILASSLPFNQDQRKLLTDLKGGVLIVRSSSNEDGAAVNAGGNESVPNVAAEETALKKTLTKVVRSYFNAQSFKNRSAFEDPYSKFPRCSVLVMEQIVENSNDPTSIVSGVMMTSKKGWSAPGESGIAHITASWGFGSGTSNKMVCDEWMVADGHVYASVRQKAYSNKPSLSLEQVKELQKIAKNIEAKFRQPMDVEFVVKGDQFYIVQARPIQEPHIQNISYLDPDFSLLTKQYQGQMIISGLNQVLFLKKGRMEICFAPDLESAEKNFNPKLHRAVVVYTSESSNTHPAVNFASYQPPIPCLMLPYEKYQECLKSYSPNFQLCPQTGLLVETRFELPVRKGLFLHPAQLAFEDQEEYSNQDIEVLKELLKATPEVLSSRMNAIEEQFKRVLIDEKFQKDCLYELEAMKKAIRQHHMTQLAFHAGMLRQLARAAIPISKPIQDFIGSHKSSMLLCELASLGANGFDEEVQDDWLKFLEEKHDEKKLQQLLKDLKELEAIGIITEWFSLYFLFANLDQLLSQNAALLKMTPIAHKVKFLSESLAKASSIKDLQNIWEVLGKVTEEFLQLKVKNPLFIKLIDLWDLSTKMVRTLHLDHTQFKARVDAFEKFAKLANNHYSLNHYLDEVFEGINKGRGKGDFDFSVQHWLIPISHGALAKIRTDDERLTVLHQNLLQAAAFGQRESLPLKLRTFYTIFNDALTMDAKRFSDNKGTFISVGKSQASVRINIPLNYHSSLVTLSQKRESEKCEVMFYMRGSDNWRGKHLNFFVMFSQLARITLKSGIAIDSDLKIIFSIENEEQASLLSRAINHINAISTGGSITDLESLLWVLDPEEKNSETLKTKIWMCLWEKLKKTGILLNISSYTHKDLYKFLKNNNQSDELVNRVIEELIGEKPKSDFTRCGFDGPVLEDLPSKKCEEIVWKNLTNGEPLSPHKIPKNIRSSLLKRLFEEQPAKAKEYYKINVCYPCLSEGLEIFIELMNAKLSSGGIKTRDELELLFWMAFHYKDPSQYSGMRIRGPTSSQLSRPTFPEQWIKALKSWEKDVLMLINNIDDYTYHSGRDKFQRLEDALGIKPRVYPEKKF